MSQYCSCGQCVVCSPRRISHFIPGSVPVIKEDANISELRKEIAELKAKLAGHQERIETLEIVIDKTIEPNLDANLQRIAKLEEYIWPQKRIEPHTCPICEGVGCDAAAYKLADPCKSCCHACEGKGIVWG